MREACIKPPQSDSEISPPPVDNICSKNQQRNEKEVAVSATEGDGYRLRLEYAGEDSEDEPCGEDNYERQGELRGHHEALLPETQLSVFENGADIMT